MTPEADPLRKLLEKVSNLLVAALSAPVHVYRYAISPLLGPRCRFYPTCSEYFLIAMKTHGPIKGIYLGARRLLRCHPGSDGGHDPVPSSGCKHDAPTKETKT